MTATHVGRVRRNGNPNSLRAGGGGDDDESVSGDLASRCDRQVVLTQVHAVRTAEQRDVYVDVDDEERVLQQLTHSPCQAEQLSAREVVMPELADIHAATLRRSHDAADALPLCVRR